MREAANGARGDAVLMVGGERHVLRLTLGALAEIETGLGLTNFEDLQTRLAKPSAADLAVVLSALARAGGSAIEAADLHAADLDLSAAVRAIAAAFGAGEAPGKPEAPAG